MKRTAIAVATSALVAVSMGFSTTANAQENKGGKPWMVRICQYHVNERGTFDNMGECMERVRAGAERYCSSLERRGYFDRPDARWNNVQQCEAWYKTRK